MARIINDLFEKRIKEVAPKDEEGLLACAREITQELALFGLYRVGFGKFAAFHGERRYVYCINLIDTQKI